MPRKAKPKLTRDDLAKIIDGNCKEVPRLIEWAKDENNRRTKAGEEGGRGKKKK